MQVQTDCGVQILIPPGMRAVADLAGQGRLKAHIDAVFSLAEGAKDHALSETGRSTGKIVLDRREDQQA
ncbi:hypothetical protein GCM10022223_13920 [Kineosporia mesophila]|uniref:Uncharacterized protein n=1 Tax=Kineosporia mesophila TaxID=566012 RepID=A0ABP6Z6S8_9ACTN|nr:zinc-binding dehydrogenase [Kineosporia mesophila]